VLVNILVLTKSRPFRNLGHRRGAWTAKKASLLLDHFLLDAETRKGEFRQLNDSPKQFKNGTFSILGKKQDPFFTLALQYLQTKLSIYLFNLFEHFS
jgi:hypothetical protein